MKGTGFVFIFCTLATAGFGQHAKNTLALTVSGNDRISVVKSSVRLAEWHEKSFWPVYESYLGEAVEVYSQSYRSLSALANADHSVSEQEAFENGWNVLAFRKEEITLKKKYYEEVAAILNGIVAFQFMQTETMMDMLETAQIYSNSNVKQYRFTSQSLSSDQIKDAKYNMLTAAMAMPADKQGVFWNVYSRYEEECDALLGESYNVYSLFASDAADFTPALAKRLGRDLLQIMEREVRLKEKYFLEMNALAGSSVAARFLAWEDYYSVVSKMYAWAETP